MDFTQLSPSQLLDLIKFVEMRHRIVSRINDIDIQLNRLGTAGISQPIASKRTKTSPDFKTQARKPSITKRGAIKDSILAALKGASAEGLSAVDIAKKTGLKTMSVSVWLVTTGKSVAEIRKVSRGRYIVSQASPIESATKQPETEMSQIGNHIHQGA